MLTIENLILHTQSVYMYIKMWKTILVVEITKIAVRRVYIRLIHCNSIPPDLFLVAMALNDLEYF